MKTPSLSKIILIMCALFIFGSAFATAPHADAATITVMNTNDSGAGSLRQALLDASDGDTIDFSVTGTILLTNGHLLVDKSVTVSGPGADQLAVNGNANGRVFYIGSGKTVSISGLTITNGSGVETVSRSAAAVFTTTTPH